MKKRFIALLISSLLLFTFLYAENDEYKISVPKEKCGTYLPLALIEHFEKTLDFESARGKYPKDCYDVLAVREDICLSDVNFHDGFALETEEFNELSFEEKGDDLYLVDRKGNKYKRISLKANCYTETDAYVTSKLFECIKDLKDVDVIGNELLIKGKGYKGLILESMWWDTSDSLAIISGDGLKTKGMSGGLYEGIPKGYVIGHNVSDEEIIHFPLLSYTPLIPLEEMEVSELRLYRNLQFARHGYKFKSKDLTEIFSQFEWYHPQKNNKGINLTKEEQDIVNKCLVLEEAKKKENSKKKILSLSKEKKAKEIEGVWYAKDSDTNEPYGYVFKQDGTFEYIDTVTKNSKKWDSVGCKGSWKINDNDIYIKIASWKSLGGKREKNGSVPIIDEHIYERSAFYKIGSFTTFEGEKDEKKITLCPITLTDVDKINVVSFYYNREDSDKINDLSFYDYKFTTVDFKIKYNDYFKDFFGDEKFTVNVFTDYSFPIFIAQSIIDEENKISNKAVVYKLNDGVIDILLNFEGDKITNGYDILYDYSLPSIYGWKVKIEKDSKTSLPYINALPFAQDVDTVLDMKTFDILDNGRFALSAKVKGEMLSEVNIEPNYGLTKEVVILPKGTDGKRGKEAQYVLFGDWPQSRIKDNVEVYDSSTPFNINGWDCYKGSDGGFYTNWNGGYLYLKMEPIKWCVISDDYQGGKLLLAEECLDYSCFQLSQTYDPLREIEGQVIKHYDYKYSYIRAYLNGLDGSSYNATDLRGKGMINKAFTKKASRKINTVEIKIGENETIKDKLFLLSDEEVMDAKLGFNAASDSTRIKATTYYCQLVQGHPRQYLLGEWWLRSPHLDSGPKEDGPYIVCQDGSLDFTIISDKACIVPAISVSF